MQDNHEANLPGSLPPGDDTTDGNTLDRPQRLRALLDMVAVDGRLTVHRAAAELGVSPATVRRDFGALADQQLVKRTHGGVVSSCVAYDLPLKYRGDRTSPEHEHIARAAADLVQPGQVVAFNGGLTTSAVARHIAAEERFLDSPTSPALTVLTNALNIASEMVLRPHLRTVTLGGVARAHAYELTGPHAIEVLDRYWADILFLGVDGLCPQGGASTEHAEEAGVNAAMVERAARVIVVAVADKIGKRTFANICQPDKIDTIVTDNKLTTAHHTALTAAGITVIVASE